MENYAKSMSLHGKALTKLRKTVENTCGCEEGKESWACAVRTLSGGIRKVSALSVSVYTCIFVNMYICIYVCMCVCVCVRIFVYV